MTAGEENRRPIKANVSLREGLVNKGEKLRQLGRLHITSRKLRIKGQLLLLGGEQLLPSGMILLPRIRAEKNRRRRIIIRGGLKILNTYRSGGGHFDFDVIILEHSLHSIYDTSSAFQLSIISIII